MSDQLIQRQHVDQTPGIRGGKPCIRGTRVTVCDIVLWTEQGMSPDELVTNFSQLDIADVHAALAYYHDNREALDTQIRDSQEFAAWFRNIANSRADGDQVSP